MPRCDHCPLDPDGPACPAARHPRYCELAATRPEYRTIIRDRAFREAGAGPAPARGELPPGTLVVRAHLNSFTGYGQLAAELGRGLGRAGIPVTFEGQADETLMPLDPWVKDRVVGPGHAGPRLVVLGPSATLSPGDAALTMWETDRIKPEWAANLNRAPVVMVPCGWNLEGFRASGVTAPIRVVPLGVDPGVFHPAGPEPAGRVVFGAAGRLAHGGVRKGIEDVVEAFTLAFPTEADVELRVKVWPDCRIDDPADRRVHLDRAPLSPAGLAGWYRSLSVFVSASRAEGWGLQPHQAMACGRPAIAPIFGGHAAYMTPESCYPVAFDVEPVPPDHPIYACPGARWSRPRMDSLVGQLRAAYEDGAARRRKGEAAARRAAEFTWRRSGDAMAEVLREFGLVPPAPTPIRPTMSAPADPRPTVAEMKGLLALVKACPARKPPGCGCPGAQATCSMGKFAPHGPSLNDCLSCMLEGLPQ